jgi:hypothetical protein
MPGRSWMAALTLALAALSIAPALADDRNPAPPSPGQPNSSPPSTPIQDEKPVATGDPAAPPAQPIPPVVRPPAGSQTVKLELRIAGLGKDGCDVEIKPSHAGCIFGTVKKHVDSRGWLDLKLDDVRSRNADRDCSFAITIHEPGQGQRTTHRGLQLKVPGTVTAQTMTVYLSSPSKIARASQPDAATKR